MLTTSKRKEYMKALGLTYDKKGIKSLQSKYFRKADVDGIYGNDTDILLRHVYNVHLTCKNFRPDEFRCPCGKCTGYPTYMRQNALKNVQALRDKFGALTVTSALRCKTENARVGGIKNSKHLTGKAVDVCGKSTTTLSKRKNVINYAKKLKNHNYAYCDGWCSYGYSVSWRGMGDSVHIDTK